MGMMVGMGEVARSPFYILQLPINRPCGRYVIIPPHISRCSKTFSVSCDLAWLKLAEQAGQPNLDRPDGAKHGDVGIFCPGRLAVLGPSRMAQLGLL